MPQAPSNELPINRSAKAKQGVHGQGGPTIDPFLVFLARTLGCAVIGAIVAVAGTVVLGFLEPPLGIILLILLVWSQGGIVMAVGVIGAIAGAVLGALADD